MRPDSATPAPTLAGIILAAGESSRMGTDKALLIYRGRTFLEVILSTLHGAGIDRVVVVLGHHAEETQRAVDLSSAQVVVNTGYRRGQTSSLQAGLRALESDKLAAVVLCLVDHPAVSVETLRKLMKSFRMSGSSVVIPTFQDQRGHPVLIGRALFAELKNLGPEQGANAVIRKHRAATQFVQVNDAGILTDVDDPETYRGLK